MKVSVSSGRRTLSYILAFQNLEARRNLHCEESDFELIVEFKFVDGVDRRVDQNSVEMFVRGWVDAVQESKDHDVDSYKCW